MYSHEMVAMFGSPVEMLYYQYQIRLIVVSWGILAGTCVSFITPQTELLVLARGRKELMVSTCEMCMYIM